jgi:hypothetical protein
VSYFIQARQQDCAKKKENERARNELQSRNQFLGVFVERRKFSSALRVKKHDGDSRRTRGDWYFLCWCDVRVHGIMCSVQSAQFFHRIQSRALSMTSDQTRQRAEKLFKKEERARDGRIATIEYEAEAIATREKTARLKALRLAKEAEARSIIAL